MTLEIKHLSVSYGDFEVLKDISFQLEEGQLIGLVAPNGTGKTTLFNAIMRFIQVKEGQIFVDGKEYTASDKDVLALHQKILFSLINPIYLRISLGENILKCMPKFGRGEEKKSIKLSPVFK